MMIEKRKRKRKNKCSLRDKKDRYIKEKRDILINIAKKYDFLWWDRFGNMRWNNIYDHKLRYVFKTCVFSLEIFKPCNHPSRTNNINPAKYWYRVESYRYKDISEEQWKDTLEFISYQYE